MQKIGVEFVSHYISQSIAFTEVFENLSRNLSFIKIWQE